MSSYPAVERYVIGSTQSIAGRLRVADRRFQNDAGWFSWRGVSDLAAMGDVLIGGPAAVWRRFDAYARARRTVVRVLGMLGDPAWGDLRFSPSTPGYFSARDTIVAQANARGLYVEWCLFADAQIVMPSHDDRRELVRWTAAWCRTCSGVVPQIANEPFKNGWSEADDPRLLELADLFADGVGHRDFSIGDPVDGNNPDASVDTTRRLVTISQHCTIAVLHPDRAFGGDRRWRRWVDHLEGMTDALHQLETPSTYVIDEPVGAAPYAIPGRRDADPDAFVAAQFVAACCAFGGYTYHKIDSEIDVDDLPGFYEIAALLAQVGCSPDWRYYNDTWAGSPTNGITWHGLEGKMRSLVNGDHAWTVAYGEGNFDSVVWREGWTPTIEYAGARVRVWSVTK